MTPHSAAKAIGVAARMMIGAIVGRMAMRYPTNSKTSPRIGME